MNNDTSEVDYIEQKQYIFYLIDGKTIPVVETVRIPKIDILNSHIKRIKESTEYPCDLCNKRLVNVYENDINGTYFYCDDCVNKYK